MSESARARERGSHYIISNNNNYNNTSEAIIDYALLLLLLFLLLLPACCLRWCVAINSTRSLLLSLALSLRCARSLSLSQLCVTLRALFAI